MWFVCPSEASESSAQLFFAITHAALRERNQDEVTTRATCFKSAITKTQNIMKQTPYAITKYTINTWKADLIHTGYPNTCLNRCVFTCLLKESTESADCTSAGRAFPSLAMASQVWSLPVLRWVRGTNRKVSLVDWGGWADEEGWSSSATHAEAWLCNDL